MPRGPPLAARARRPRAAAPAATAAHPSSSEGHAPLRSIIFCRNPCRNTPVQPAFGNLPVSLHGGWGLAHHFCRLHDGEAGKVAQFDEPTELWIEGRQLREGVIKLPYFGI